MSQNEPFLTCLGHGGLGMNPSKTAVLFIELQNEFATKGGKLHESVREVMEKTNMLENCIKVFNEICNNTIAWIMAMVFEYSMPPFHLLKEGQITQIVILEY